MKKYLVILLASAGLVGCAHHADRGGTYNQSDTYRGGTATGSESEQGYSSGDYSSGDMKSTLPPPNADRSSGATEQLPPPVSTSPSNDQEFQP